MAPGSRKATSSAGPDRAARASTRSRTCTWACVERASQRGISIPSGSFPRAWPTALSARRRSLWSQLTSLPTQARRRCPPRCRQAPEPIAGSPSAVPGGPASTPGPGRQHAHAPDRPRSPRAVGATHRPVPSLSAGGQPSDACSDHDRIAACRFHRGGRVSCHGVRGVRGLVWRRRGTPRARSDARPGHPDRRCRPPDRASRPAAGRGHAASERAPGARLERPARVRSEGLGPTRRSGVDHRRRSNPPRHPGRLAAARGRCCVRSASDGGCREGSHRQAWRGDGHTYTGAPWSAGRSSSRWPGRTPTDHATSDTSPGSACRRTSSPATTDSPGATC